MYTFVGSDIMLKAVFFDLDGTLLPFNEDEFVKIYVDLLHKKIAPLGYEKDTFIKCLWTGVEAMTKNDGSISNEEIFRNTFQDFFGKESLKHKDLINSFYTNEFKKVQSICKENPYVRDIINYCKDNNLLVVLATNPIFPKPATLTRMSFIGLNEDDFDYITVYENSSLSKPNVKYYQMLLDKLNLKADEVLMFGNNEYEDGIASTLGMKVYMVGDYIIRSDEINIYLEHIDISQIKSIIEIYIK